MEILFLHKGFGNAIPVRNEVILPCIFSINPLKNHRRLKQKLIKILNDYRLSNTIFRGERRWFKR